MIRDAAELKVKETTGSPRGGGTPQDGGTGGGDGGRADHRRANSLDRGALLDSHGDHRIGMAMAVAGLASEGEVRVKGAEAISVSFPNFAEILKELE